MNARAKEIYHPQISRIEVSQDRNETAASAGERIIAEVNRNPHLRVTFATGNTMIPVYEYLARARMERRVDFSNIQAFHLDEYYPIKPNDPESFVGYLYHYVFLPLGIKPDNIHTLNGSASDPDGETKDYDKLLSLQPATLTLLGVGPGGHIGFNEPGSDFAGRTHLAKLSDETVTRDRIERGQHTPEFALTQGIGTILESEMLLLIAYGAHKGDYLHDALYNGISEESPASALRLVGNKVHLFVDEDAATKLHK